MDECWTWKGEHNENGYALYSGGTRAQGVAFYLLHGRKKRPKQDLHHRCLNRGCVNPRHVVEMTHAEHMREHARIRREATAAAI
jgi:hypothetical protein